MFALFLKNRLDKFGIHYGWVIVFMAFLTSMFSSAIISTPQILILPITNAYGWGISDVTSSIGVMYLILASFAVLSVGLGSGIYLVANLGPGPRDGLMTGLQKKTNFPIAAVRAFLEITVVSIGCYLGGIVGVGTLLFAFGVGPAVALGLYLVKKIFS